MATGPQQAKIPEVVDVSETDSERKELYTEAGKVFTEERRKALEAQKAAGPGQVFVPGQEPVALEPAPEPVKVEFEVEPEDKRAFVRAILADRTFEKVYPLFGGEVEATFVDRSVAETDKLFNKLDSGAEDDEWVKRADILCLCSTLREVKTKNGRNSFPPTDEFEKRSDEIKALKRPLYEALMDASRNFEELVNHLVAKARDSDFWQAGGSASPLKRTTGK